MADNANNENKFVIDSRIGDILCKLIEQQTGQDCHIILLAFPIEAAKPDGTETIGGPCVVTSMEPESMKHTIVSFADFLQSEPGRKMNSVTVTEQ